MSNFRLEVVDTHEDLSELASACIIGQIGKKPDSLICLATGSTPTGTYRMLAEQFRGGAFRTDMLTVAQIDEWVGLPNGDPHTCRSYLIQNVIEPLEITRERFISIESHQPTMGTALLECARVQKLLDRYQPNDLMVLGLGINGHIGMNEPQNNPELGLQEPVHLEMLSDKTQQHSMIRGLNVKAGITLGADHILESKEILLLVSGIAKSAVLRDLMYEYLEPTIRFPASYLREAKNVTVIADKAAAARL